MSSKTTSRKTDHEDLNRPDEGIIQNKKIDTTVEHEKSMRKQTETRMVFTGRLEDIAPLINGYFTPGSSPYDRSLLFRFSLYYG